MVLQIGTAWKRSFVPAKVRYLEGLPCRSMRVKVFSTQAEGRNLEKRKKVQMPDERIVISGISGRFPNSENLREFRDNLINGVDMVTPQTRWSSDRVPPKYGLLRNMDKFDAGFFGIVPKLAEYMDPQQRKLLEVTFEAIIDAGINPGSLKGSRVGVFVGAVGGEAQDYQVLNGNADGALRYHTMGVPNFMLANRISYSFDLKGTSVHVSTGCSASMIALEQAVAAITRGTCEAAIVAGSTVHLNARVSEPLVAINALAPDGICKAFDDAADGFVRSEAVVAILIQKESAAKRNYALIRHIESNSDGYKSEGLMFPSGKAQEELLRETYQNADIDPASVTYLEAHGTGTPVGDPQEIEAIYNVFCKDVQRGSPLVVGSVKSNAGHTESAAGLVSIAKVLTSIQEGVIPPNLHFNTPNSFVKHLFNESLAIAQKPIPWAGGLIGISSFGLGGTNSHLILEPGPIKHLEANQDLSQPVLIPFSGRTKEGVEESIREATVLGGKKPEFFALLHNAFRETIPGHNYRGYGLLRPGEPEEIIQVDSYEATGKRPLWFIFPGMGSQWNEMGLDLMKFPPYAESLLESSKVLEKAGVNLKELLKPGNGTIFSNIRDSLVSITAVQIALTDLLNSIGLRPDGFVGHSSGEILCAYADGCLTKEETLLVGDARGRAFQESVKEPGGMAAVGLSWQEIKSRCPPDIFPACHNAATNVSISGPKDAIRQFVAELQREGVFAREINSCNCAPHSRHVFPAHALLDKYMKEIYSDDRPRSSRWISSSIPEKDWDTPLAKYSSVQYHVNNMGKPVLFHEAIQHVPSDAVVVEIAPRGLFQGLLKESLPNCVHVAPMNSAVEDKVSFFLNSIGRVYNAGVDVDVSQLYPMVKFPVSANTPSISPLVKWNHEDSRGTSIVTYPIRYGRMARYDLHDQQHSFLSGHKLGSKTVFPATGYLFLAWNGLAELAGTKIENFPITFENVAFERATFLNENSITEFKFSVLDGMGNFEIREDDMVIVKGTVRRSEGTINMDWKKMEAAAASHMEGRLSKDDIYQELRLRGYNYSGAFQGLASIDKQGRVAEAEWTGNWTSFLDTVLQTSLLSIQTRNTIVPVRLQSVTIDPTKFLNFIKSTVSLSPDESAKVPISVNKHMNSIQCPGIEIKGVSGMVIPPRRQENTLSVQKFAFSPFIDPHPKESVESAIWEVVDTVKDNTKASKVSLIDIFHNAENSLMEVLHQGFAAKNFDIGNVNMMTLTEEAGKLHENTISLGELICKDKVELLQPEFPADLVAIDDLKLLPAAASVVSENAFILLQEDKYPTEASSLGLKTVLEMSVNGKTFTLLRKMNSPTPRNLTQVEIDCEEFNWLPKLQSAISKSDPLNSRIYLTSQNDPNSGILGLAKCLALEKGGESIRCIFDPEGKLTLDFANPDQSLSEILEKDLFINVYKDGRLGNYFHLPLDENWIKNLPSKPVEHAFVNTLTTGDLSSLRWIESPLEICNNQGKDSSLCKVSYAAMNFRDVMLATGKLPLDASSSHQDCVLGFEFSGHDNAGNRVMGIVPSKGLATSVLADPEFLWKIPENWSLEDAATIPIVYATAYYALFNRGRLTPGQSILIHSGSGGVGQAAISIALAHHCEIFTTVGSDEKRGFIKKLFPQLKDENIGNSRDCSFEPQIMELTQGRGVDLVLNSLADEKLQASVRCLATHGKFLEIGAFDSFVNTPLGMSTFLKNTEFHGIFLNQVFTTPVREKQLLKENFKKGIETGVVKPLPRTVFRNDQIEDAFRFMASGRHVGKVLIDVSNRDGATNDMSVNKCAVNAVPRTYFKPDRVYIVVGGLGGLGLEVANWMVERGAKHLILPTRSGIKSGYQELCLQKWEDKGVKVETPKIDLSDFETAKRFVQNVSFEATIGGIFNSSLVLKDGMVEDQTPENFKAVADPKISLTKNLDKLTRKHCPDLDYFVTFSSITSGRGNQGQSNYGYANSAMERICENRKEDGLPGLSIQWGVIGEVGYLGKVFDQMGKGKSFHGMVPQIISSCLEVLDQSLQQSSPVVTSVVLMDKSKSSSKGTGLITSIMNMFGIKDVSKLSPNTKLTELGMDSLIGVELKQTLEREYDLPLTVNQMRALTVGDLKRIDAGIASSKDLLLAGNGQVSQAELPFKLHEDALVKLGTGKLDSSPLFIVHGNFGAANTFESLAEKLNCDTYGFQFGPYAHLESIEDIARAYVEELKQIQPEGPYNLSGYSGGGTIAFEMANILENEHNEKVSNLVFLDGSCDWTPNKPDMKTIFTSVLAVAEAFANFTEKEKSDFRSSLGDNFEANIHAWKECYKKKVPQVNTDQLIEISSIYIKYVTAAFNHVPTEPFSGNVTLVKTTQKQFFEDDMYNIQKHVTGKLSAYVVRGSHFTFLSEDFVQETADILNEILNDKPAIISVKI